MREHGTPGGRRPHPQALPYSRRRGQPREPAPPRRRRPWTRRPQALLAGCATACLVVTGLGWTLLGSLGTGLTTDSVRGSHRSSGGDQNILVMGLDSRLDARGKPLPDDVYEALHAGDAGVGGLNANVLMLVHLPADGSKATALSIPRDDLVPLHGCPDGRCKGKVKQAYGLAADARRTSAIAGGAAPDDAETQARRAGRQAEVDTVSDLLGDFPVDHIVEVTLGGFYDLATTIQPISLCVAERTVDSYSGADFTPGRHSMDAAQALAYVRQRRDTGTDADLTDLDRERRQQAFVSSVLRQVGTAGTLADPQKLASVVSVVRRDVVVDDELDLPSLLGRTSSFADSGVEFYTLPISRFDRDPLGEDVNVVDAPALRTLAWSLVYHHDAPGAGSASTDTSGTTVRGDAKSDVGAAGADLTAAPAAPVAAGSSPAPTDLSVLDGGGSPCVK